LAKLSELNFLAISLFFVAAVCFVAPNGNLRGDDLPAYASPPRYDTYYNSRSYSDNYSQRRGYSSSGVPNSSYYGNYRAYDRNLRDLQGGYNRYDRRYSSTLPSNSNSSLLRNDTWKGPSSNLNGYYSKPESNITGTIPNRSTSSLFSSQRRPFSLKNSELESRLAKQANRASKDILRYDTTESENSLEEGMNLLESQRRKVHVDSLEELKVKDSKVKVDDSITEKADLIEAERMQKVLTPEGFDAWLKLRMDEKDRKEKQDSIDEKKLQPDKRGDEKTNPKEKDADGGDATESESKNSLKWQSESFENYDRNITYEQALQADEKYAEFEKVAQANHDKYVNIGDKLLKEGHYYDARDAYSMAAAWDSDSPAALAGRGYAHFAAGEYMSSATHLMWAIESGGTFLKMKINIADVIGNAELFDKRFSELDGVYQGTGFYKSAFLLAYISYQNGQHEKAAEYIKAADEAVSGNKAIVSLKKIIDNGLETDSRE